MGDHFVFLVDRLLTESTLEAAIESRNPKQLASPTTNSSVTDCSSQDSDPLSPRKMVECRICQDEDMDSNMEVPCSCCGSLKYAHRRCVQRWCNEKGDTICEICHQFMLLLVLRHTLPIIVNQAEDYSFPLVMLLLLRITGIVLPIYIIMKAVTSCHRRQHQQAILPISSSDEESGPVILSHQPPPIIAP
ncbi:hypothetical protein AABB24_009092 [Solanum stoloniferum]|uniref:RING-CH-type domain-containing protein n=1 Tax=Solanum stoloniferum TaxID=62892 RepID=A0ABD2UGW7_9SOLN